MQTLLNKIRDRGQRDEVTGQMEEMEMQDTAGSEDLKAKLNEHLGGLPENVKRSLAAHLTPEFAKLVGAVTGSAQLADALGNMANPDIALVPMPREEAMKIAQQVQSQQAPTPEATTPQPTGPSGPMGM